jgi:hypothetical protein
MEKESERELTRRSVLRMVPVLALALPFSGMVSLDRVHAQVKVSKEIASYQDRPNGNQMCSDCAHFNPPVTCAVVAGDISMQGWSRYWAPKRR